MDRIDPENEGLREPMLAGVNAPSRNLGDGGGNFSEMNVEGCWG